MFAANHISSSESASDGGRESNKIELLELYLDLFLCFACSFVGENPCSFPNNLQPPTPACQ